MIHVPGAGFCDDQLPVLSTIGRGPVGPEGKRGKKGDKGDKGDTSSFEPLTDTQIDIVTNDGILTSSNGLDGTGLTYLWGKVKAKFAAKLHSHSASDITSGELAIDRGGTGASSASNARTSLGTPASSSIAPVESVVATANHAVGDYFMLGDVLMKATATIIAGEQITASNATPATVQGQIDTLRGSVCPAIKIIGTAETYDPREVSNYPAIEAELPTHSCIVELNIGLHYFGMYEYASSNYKSLLLFNYNSVIIHSRKVAGIWSVRTL